MPAPTTVTDQAVIEAGQQLAAQGKRITGWTLRTLLGTGRASRLQEIWTAHAAEADEQVQAPPAPPLPAALETQATALQMRMAGEVEAMVVAVWQAAERISMERMASEVDAAREASARTTADLEAAEQAVVDAEAERDQAVAQAEQLRVETREARAEADRQRGHAEATDARAQRAEAAAAAALEKVRAGAEERGRLLERLERAERAEADLRTQAHQRVEKAVA